MLRLQDLLEQRSTTVAAMRTIADSPAGEDGDLSADQVAQFDRHKASLESLEARIARQQALDDAERRIAAPVIISGNGRDGRFEERARGFSLVKAINASLGDPVDAGFEREIREVRSRAAAAGRTFQGIPCPDEYFLERRVLTVGTGGDAEALYPTVHRGDLYIDLLRSALLLGRLGATVLDGLVGDQEIPKQTGSVTAQWLGEEDALDPSDASFDDVSLTPHTVGALTSYSRRTLINAVPAVENLVRQDLAATIAREIDFQALFGDGLNNRPIGLVNQDGVEDMSLAGPTWAQVLGMIAAVQAADADLGNMRWAMNARAVAKLRATPVVTDSDTFLMTDPGSLAGYPVVVSNMLRGRSDVSPPVGAAILFGAWAQLLVGFWSGLDVLANPYSDSAYVRGRVMVRAMRDVDVAVRHPESFVVSGNMSV